MEQEIHLDVEELEERVAPTVIAIRQVRLRKTGPTIKLRGLRADMGRWMRARRGCVPDSGKTPSEPAPESGPDAGSLL